MSEAENPIGREMPDSTDLSSNREGDRQETGIDAAEGSIEQSEVQLGENPPLEDARPSTPLENPAAFPIETQIAPENIHPMAEALTWETDSDIAELVGLNQALHDQNSELLNHVEQLEKLLEECHSALQSQMKLRANAEAKLAQQMQESATSQEQVARMFRELEASHQVAQRQQILIETLSQQLESSQEQVAYLERECALTQQRYNEQAQQLAQTEQLCQELRSRLQRQQRYTLQFKAALNKCLEMPTLTPSKSNTGNPPAALPFQSPPQKTAIEQQLSLKPQPIQPWSATPELAAEEQKTVETDTTPIQPPDWFLETEEVATHEEPSHDEPQEVTLESFARLAAAEVVPPAEASTEVLSDVTHNLCEAEEILWQEIQRLTESAITLSHESASEAPPVTPSEDLEESDDGIDLSLFQTDTSPEPVSEPIPPEPSPEGVTAEPAGQLTPYPTYPNSPSPLVYPQRSQKKKLKSLAAIDLPSFPRLSSKPSAPVK